MADDICCQYQDLLIIDGDIGLTSAAREPLYSWHADMIAQDIKHRLIESGLIFELVAIRSLPSRQQQYTKITREVQRDQRIIPASVNVYELEQGAIVIVQAATYCYGDVIRLEWRYTESLKDETLLQASDYGLGKVSNQNAGQLLLSVIDLLKLIDGDHGATPPTARSVCLDRVENIPPDEMIRQALARIDHIEADT